VWSIVERHRVTHLGISPTAIRGLMRSGDEPVQRHDRSSLFVLGSTGEPWNPEPWWWYFGVVGEKRIPLINYSGGTECAGGILGCTTWTPLEPTAFAGPVPGIAADVVDERGASLRGAVGELVIRKPWPGMTRGFWRDPDKYVATYWSRFPGVWVHGDWARIDDAGFWFIEGRSDDTLKVAGKRIGPAEVESAATAHAAVLEAAAIGVPHELKGEAIVVFVVLRTGPRASDALAREIADAIAERLGRPLRPEAVRFVTDLPKTRNAKILRRVIRGAYLGKTDLGDLSSLENPGAVEKIRALRATSRPESPS
jgi:acetyl-CoA synthetase